MGELKAIFVEKWLSLEKTTRVAIGVFSLYIFLYIFLDVLELLLHCSFH